MTRAAAQWAEQRGEVEAAREQSPSRGDSWLMPTALAISALALAFAIQLNNGALAPQALLLVTVALAAGMVAVLAPSGWAIESWGDRPAVLVLGAGLALEIGVSLVSPAGVYLRGAPDRYQEHHIGLAAAAVLAGAGLSGRPWLGAWRVPLLLAVHFWLGVWLIHQSPNPYIDVFTFHNEAFAALSHHVDPYAITMPNIYGRTTWYAGGLATPTRVLVGFLYPPLSLFFAWLGHWAGDYRYAMLVAMTLSGAFMAYARPGPLGSIAAATFLFTPRGLFVLEQGWTEPFVVMLVAATVFCACRAPRLIALPFGLLLAVKQYSILLLPIAFLLFGGRLSRPKLARFLVVAGIVGAVVTLPLALWNLHAFVESVVLFQGKQPFRPDALSYMAWSARDGAPVLPQWLCFAAAAIGIALAAFRAPRSPAGFAAGASLVFLLFFAFAKQAFCNYYFMVFGMSCCAIAAARPKTFS